MSLHSLLSVTIGVPDVGETAAYYTDFGLTPADDGWFSTADAGRQLRLLPAPVRRLLELRVGADDADDLARAAAGLAALGVPSQQNGTSMNATEPVTGTRVVLDVAARIRQDAIPASFLHHTSWQVDDVDDVGRGAQAMLEGRPERHVWGLGRHYAGSNFFWYLKDPAGNFSEYYSDMDCIVDDQLWTPEDLEGARGLFAWGPPPPPSFLHPEDLAAMMTGAHSAR
jgi:Glyoxalase/Bleomycin resistance protein/Dioxygenase superfamily